MARLISDFVVGIVRRRGAILALAALELLLPGISAARAEGDWEITPRSQEALARGLKWLAQNQGPEGNWECRELGLVGMGALAFLADGHLPGRGRYGENVARALSYVIRSQKPSGLLNVVVNEPKKSSHDMYNHGLSTFVLGQAYGMSGDTRIGATLDHALKLIAETQCDDGGWDYRAQRLERGHDLSLAVMQAKALRSAVDSGLDVSPRVIDLAIRSVRDHYSPHGCPRNADEETQKKFPGQFTYSGGGGGSVAMAAAGVVCLQEFAQYDDWRIAKSMEVLITAIRHGGSTHGQSQVMFDDYTLYYVGQALYQVGGDTWKECYPLLRDNIVANQIRQPHDARQDGLFRGSSRTGGGKPGDLYLTAVCCFVLAMPNRYLPILQEGRINSLREKFQQKQ